MGHYAMKPRIICDYIVHCTVQCRSSPFYVLYGIWYQYSTAHLDDDWN